MRPRLCSNEENFRTTSDRSTGLTHNECAPFQTPSYVLYSALGSFFLPFFVTVALYVRIGVTLQHRHVTRRDRRRTTLGGDRRRRPKGSSTVAMMCRVGNDLCTAATAAVVVDRLEIDEEEIGQSVTPGKAAGTGACYRVLLSQFISYY